MDDNLNSENLQSAVDYIDSWLELNFNNSRIPALQVAIQHGDKLVYSRPFGYADLKNKTKLSKSHVFRIASHSKTFTSTAIMQLVENGKLGLDDKVSQHIDWFKSTKDERVSQITVRQLLNHTAGIIRDGTDASFWDTLRPFPDEAELQKLISTGKLIYDADVQFKYSNLAFSYLGFVIEAASGMKYREYMTKNIVERLGLLSTGPDLDDRALAKLANGYGMQLFNQNRRRFDHADTQAMSAATGFYSNAEDLCKYFAAHFLGNPTLISDISKRQMQHGYWESHHENERYGLGLVNYLKRGWSVFGHGGGFPGFSTSTRFDAKKKLAVSVLTNAHDAPAKYICGGLINIIDTFWKNAGHNKSKTATHSKFAGRFYSLWGPNDIVAVGEKLFAVEPLYWTEFESASELFVVDEKTLKIGDSLNYGSSGETIKFNFDNDGKADSIVYAGRPMLPLAQAERQGWFKAEA
ncbi:MAG: beta-lactamase family protein [Candidatus Nomurabacteria bacterium]|jgi:CubicO group peptidase (beta-lactamase class C family)|nr:beta-lactamase family protein [Candidatus Nomurabacteria bacterium]